MLKLTTLKTALIGAGLLATSGLVLAQQGERSATQDVERVLEHISGYSFTHVVEIEWESRDQIDIEGFLDDGWFAEVRFSASGEPVREERERLITGAWGLTPQQVETVLNRGIEAGMVRFDELDVSSRGYVELEGYNDRGREIEINLSLSDL